MFKRITRTTVPLVALAGGFFLFPKEWRKNHQNVYTLNHFNEEAAKKLTESSEYQVLDNNKAFTRMSISHEFPQQHKENHATSGILFGPHLMEVDLIIFINPSDGELVSFFHLGAKLVSHDGQIHNGVVSTILDEGLCACGFSKLPSKKGVTAKLSIDFLNQARPESTVVLRAKVTEAKGRKVVIQGRLELLAAAAHESIPIASAECVLVEPKWFKYFSWLQL